MSRIGNKIITIPEGVKVEVNGNDITVKGPKGENHVHLPANISLDFSEEGTIVVKRANEIKQTKQNHGTVRSLLHNAIVGASEGYTIKLDIIGIGYRASMKGDSVLLDVGYSHETVIAPHPGATISVENPTTVVVTGYNKHAVGQTAALIRAVRKPEPYKGKGIKYRDEKVIRKEGKRAGAKK
ncbi:MAG: 50S ribosomal protein L6 [Bacilli bacterium]|jgi:large subunit ribosomal protein L6